MHLKPTLLSAAALIVACGAGTEPAPPAISRLIIAPGNAHLLVQETRAFQVSALDETGAAIHGFDAGWSMTDTGVATVNGGGSVIALSIGRTYLRAGFRGKVDSVLIDVVDSLTVVTLILFPGADSTLIPGDQVTLPVELRDSLGRVFVLPVGFGSADPTVAAIDAGGMVTAQGYGRTLITATVGALQATWPVRVSGYSAIAVAWENGACALRTDSTTYCWGSDVQAPLVPTRVEAPSPLMSIRLGTRAACGIGVDAKTYCWGFQNYPRFGVGPSSGAWVLTPTLVLTGLTFRYLTVGAEHQCGIATDGSGYCWGAVNHYGEIGDGTNLIPRTVPTALRSALTWRDLAAAGYTTCGVTTAGEAWCWGANSNDVLGVDSTNSAVQAPLPVYGGGTYTSIVSGAYHNCALSVAGSALCWGSNFQGQLGIDTLGGIFPTPRAVAGGLVFTELAAGEYHTCGIAVGGAAWCWGRGLQGQLGQTISVAVAPFPVSGGYTFAQINARSDQTCAVTSDGKAYCWGSGALGDGTLKNDPSGVLVRVQDP